MKTWAVAVATPDDKITIEIIRENSWHGAAAKHSKLQKFIEDIDFTTRETMEETVDQHGYLIQVIEVEYHQPN